MISKAPIDTVVLITRRTALKENLRLFQTKGQAKFIYRQKALAYAVQAEDTSFKSKAGQTLMRSIEKDADEAFGRLEQEDSDYESVVQRLRSSVPKSLKVQRIEREQLPQFVWAANHLPVVVGVDGLVVNTAKYLDGQPIIAINPDPESIDGVLLPFQSHEFPRTLARTLDGAANTQSITMAEAVLDDGQRLLAFNDLFIGRASHVSARYTVHYAGASERHSSSGVIVSTGAGSTGWMRSVIQTSAGVQKELAKQAGYSNEGYSEHTGRASNTWLRHEHLDWDARQLRFAVREAFPSRTTGTDVVLGDIDTKRRLFIESEMPEGGVIFSDGVEQDYLSFSAGTRAEIRVADKVAQLVVKDQSA